MSIHTYYIHTAWTVKFVLNLVLLSFFLLKMVDNTKLDTNLKFGDVDQSKKFDNTKLNKKRVDNTKFKRNLIIQAVCTIAQLT